MERKTSPQSDGLNDKALEPAARGGEPKGANSDTDPPADEAVLASPGELAGTADRAIAAEMAALGPAEEEPTDGDSLGEAIGGGAELGNPRP